MVLPARYDGADLVPAWVDGVLVGPHAATRVPPGGVPSTGHATRGLRVYVAVRGGVDVPPVLGSRAGDQLSGLGPAPLRDGEILPSEPLVPGAVQVPPDSRPVVFARADRAPR